MRSRLPEDARFGPTAGSPHVTIRTCCSSTNGRERLIFERQRISPQERV